MREFDEWKEPEIEDGELTEWNWMVQNTEGLDLGRYTDIGAFTYINAKHGVVIEDGVQIGAHCAVYSESTIDEKTGKVRIKKNAKVGSHSVILPGVTIGENAVVGANSLVNKDIPSGHVAFGSPAEVQRKVESDE